MADLKDATPNICAGGEDMGTGPTCKVCGARPDQTCGRGLLKDAAERDRLRAELAEATRLLRELNARTYSHVDGRDLLAELHPRNMLDIRRRQDGQYTWFEGDWLSNIHAAMKPIRAFLARQEKSNE